MDENYSPYIETVIPKKVMDQAQKVRSHMAESAAHFERRNRVTTTTIVLMLSVAAFYDLLQIGFNFIPFIGWIFASLVGIYAWLTFYVWTSIKGWGFADTLKKWGVQLLYAFELISIFDDLPAITFGVFLTLLIVKSEDYVYNKTKGKVDEEVIKQGIEFFNLFRDVYHV